MNSSIDWEKQYTSLVSQMRDMMKMSLKLMPESKLVIKDIIIEKLKEQKFLTVITNGYAATFKFKCYDNKDNLIDTIDYSFRNSIELSNYVNLNSVTVEAKDEDNSIFLIKKKYL